MDLLNRATSDKVKIRKFSCENGIIKLWLVCKREQKVLILGADQLFEIERHKK